MKSIGLFILLFIPAYFTSLSFAFADYNENYNSAYDMGTDASENYYPENNSQSYDYNTEAEYVDTHHNEIDDDPFMIASNRSYDDDNYDSRPVKKKKKKHAGGGMPQQISGYGEKVIIINPRIHAWGAYNAQGQLLRSGLATAGNSWCPDIHRSCRTKSGTFRIQSLGSSRCVSSKYPIPRGGAPMPYCMFFNGRQGLHGSYQVVAGNVSHGCVRVTVDSARWIRFNFATIGTKVVVKSY